ncbi:MAG: hypothetical protein QGI45_03565 [Myxococcota bacterium]|nr:hypothetical protein [Myxococcota bacterium]
MKKTLGLILILCAFALHVEAKPLRPHEVPPDIYLDRSGLVELMAWQVVYGPATGIMLMEFLAPDDNIRRTSGIILGFGLGAGLPFFLNKDKPVHQAEAMWYNLAEIWGYFNGALLPTLWRSDNDRDRLGTMSLLSLAALGGALSSYDEMHLSPGQTSALGSGIIFGAGAGALVAGMMNLNTNDEREIGSLLLLSSNAGLLASYLLKETFDVDRRRIFWTDIGGYTGALLGLGLGWMIVGDDNFSGKEQVFSGSVLAGMLSGLYLAFHYTEELDTYRLDKNDRASEDESAFQLQSPSPMLISSYDRNEGKNVMGFGLNLLQGEW